MNQERSVHLLAKPPRAWLGLGAFGAFAVLAAILVRGDRAIPGASSPSRGASAIALPVPSSELQSVRQKTQAHRPAGAQRFVTERPANEERARLVVTAQRELEQLEAQEPKSFLAIFDMMREEGQGSEKTLDAGRRASHAYFLGRMRILEQMLRRFIEDPESDHALESEALARLDADFDQTLGTLARDVPAMANIQELLTTTVLKAPIFADPSPEAE